MNVKIQDCIFHVDVPIKYFYFVLFINIFLFFISFEPCPPVQSLKIGNVEVQGSPDILYTHHRINESERKVEKPRIIAVCKVLAVLVHVLIQYLKFEFEIIFRVFAPIFRQKLLILINLYVALLLKDDI